MIFRRMSSKRLLFILLLCLAALVVLFHSSLTPWRASDSYRLTRELAPPAPMRQQSELFTTYPTFPPSELTAQADYTSTSLSLQPTPLDVDALRLNFPRLKEAVRRHSGIYSTGLNQMMTSHLPIINTKDWHLHSPSGKQFTLEQVQAVALSARESGFLVPNVAHFVLPFGDPNIQFHHMVSLLSCLHVMKPHRLLLWYAPGRLPRGEWWERVRRNLTDSEWEERVIMVERAIPTSVYSVPVHNKEHQSDVMRMEAVLTVGGVYMDIDVFVLRPLEPLRKFAFTIGQQDYHGLCNGIFMSAPNGTFLAMWHTAYQVFNDASWVDHSVWLPFTMRPVFPDLCHVEVESMDRPNWTPEEVNWIYGIGQHHRWNWRTKNYVMHLWFRKYGQQHNMDSIKTLDSMYGQMCRFILYGT